MYHSTRGSARSTHDLPILREEDMIYSKGDKYESFDGSRMPRYRHVVPGESSCPLQARANGAAEPSSRAQQSYYISDDDSESDTSSFTDCSDSDDPSAYRKERSRSSRYEVPSSSGEYSTQRNDCQRSRDDYYSNRRPMRKHSLHENFSTRRGSERTTRKPEIPLRVYTERAVRQEGKLYEDPNRMICHICLEARSAYDPYEAKPRHTYAHKDCNSCCCAKVNPQHRAGQARDAYFHRHYDEIREARAKSRSSAGRAYTNKHVSYDDHRRPSEHLRTEHKSKHAPPHYNSSTHRSRPSHPKTSRADSYSYSSATGGHHDRHRPSHHGSEYYSKIQEERHRPGNYPRTEYNANPSTDYDRRDHDRGHTYEQSRSAPRASSPTPRPRAPRPSSVVDDIPNHYATLGLSSKATASDIKRAARQARVDNHPDCLKKAEMSIRELARIDENAKKVGMAADVLGDEKAKREYDAMLLGTNDLGVGTY